MRIFGLGVFVLISMASLGQRQVVLDLDGAVVKKSKIAVPDFDLKDDSGDLSEAWRTINDVLRADLRNSGFFEVLPESRLKLIRDPHSGPIDFAEWGSVEAQHLVVGSVRQQASRMVVEVRLYEVATQEHIIAKAYKSRADLARKTAHVIADEIMLHLRNITFATSKIIFNRDGRPASEQSDRPLTELFIMDYDGYNVMPITRGGLALSPSAVKVGNDTLLAYCVYENVNTFYASYGLYFKPNLVRKPQILFSDKDRRASTPALSNDGQKVAFSLAQDGNVDIFVMRLDGSDFLRLTRHPGVDTNPSWAPGDNSLLFTSDRTGVPQIYMMDADGLNKRRVTFENPYNDSATWNPHYDYIAYVSRFDNDFDIFVMDLKTAANYRLTRMQGSNEDPCWAPDGERLCFSSNRNGPWQIFLVNRNGENLTQITRSGNNRNPVWIP